MVATFSLGLGVEKFVISTSYIYYQGLNINTNKMRSSSLRLTVILEPNEEYYNNSTQGHNSTEHSGHSSESSKPVESDEHEMSEHEKEEEEEEAELFPNPALVTAYNGNPPIDSVSTALAIFIYIDLALLTMIVQFFDVFFVYISNEY